VLLVEGHSRLEGFVVKGPSDAGTRHSPPWTGGDPAEILCHQEDRVVGKNNKVAFDRLTLQIEPTWLRPYFVEATVQVRRYADDRIALFYHPRCIGRYATDGSALSPKVKAA
jgi:hypothetical protein